MEIVLVGNEKGGTGKSATTICLANALHGLGYRVLVVDFDPSGNLSASTLPTFPEHTLYDALTGACTIDDAIYHTDFCDILPTVRDLNLDVNESEASLMAALNSKSLTTLAMRLFGKNGAERVLRTFLRKKEHRLGENYDFVFIDSAPTDNAFFVNNGILAADSILFACEPSVNSLDGMLMFLSSIKTARSNYVGVDVQLDGIVLNRYSTQYDGYRQSIKAIQEAAVDREIYLYRTVLRSCSSIPTSQVVCRPILDYIKGNSHGPVDALNLALEFLQSRGLEPRVEFPGVHRDENGNLVYARVPKAKPYKKLVEVQQ